MFGRLRLDSLFGGRSKVSPAGSGWLRVLQELAVRSMACPASARAWLRPIAGVRTWEPAAEEYASDGPTAAA